MLLIDTEDTQAFILYIEQALAQLAAGHYAAFLDRFDESRLAEEDIILALKFLDSERPITKIDDPLMVPCAQCEIDLGKMNDGGYYLDYDLSTGGEMNDLTLSCEFLQAEGGYRVILSDLQTM